MSKLDNAYFEDMLKEWKRSTKSRSGSLTTNEHFPEPIKQKLLIEDCSLIDRLSFKEIQFPQPKRELLSIKGMDILSGLQEMGREECLTVYRAIRFPTAYRTWETVSNEGLSMPNFEQERILELYGRPEYAEDRSKIQRNPLFWVQPQERVVAGVPAFSLVNDAIQIHYAFRNDEDRVLVDVIHLPFELLESKKAKLVANSTIDLDLDNEERDYEIVDFKEKDNCHYFDYSALRARGIDLHEMYMKGLPFGIREQNRLGIEQRFFLLDISRIDLGDDAFRNLYQSSRVLKDNEYFLHGFFGDQNVFGRTPSKFLPHKCYEVSLEG